MTHAEAEPKTSEPPFKRGQYVDRYWLILCCSGFGLFLGNILGYNLRNPEIGLLENELNKRSMSFSETQEYVEYANDLTSNHGWKLAEPFDDAGPGSESRIDIGIPEANIWFGSVVLDQSGKAILNVYVGGSGEIREKPLTFEGKRGGRFMSTPFQHALFGTVDLKSEFGITKNVVIVWTQQRHFFYAPDGHSYPDAKQRL